MLSFGPSAFAEAYQHIHVKISMPPKRKATSGIGHVEQRAGGFRARVYVGRGTAYGPTRLTKEQATADLNAAREGATTNEDVARNLRALVAAARGVGAPAAEQRRASAPADGEEQRPLESCAAASANASAAEHRLPETSTAASAPACVAEQRMMESCATAMAAKQAVEERQPETSTAACAAKLPVERRRPALSDEGEISRKLRSRAVEAGPLAVRIVDHASASSSSVSSRVAAICTSAGLHARADLSCDQPTDACGYIAADAVVRLRDAALAEAEGWLTAALPDYASLAAVRRGEAALGRGGAERVLEEADVNALVRHYSHLEAHSQAHEEWWGGAVSLDNFLDGGLAEFLCSLAEGQEAHLISRVAAMSSGQILSSSAQQT